MKTAHDWTDKELEEMEKRITAIYEEAQSSIREKWDAYMERAEKRIEKYEKALEEAKAGGDKDEIKKAENEIKRRKENITIRNEYYQGMIDETTDHLANVNNKAVNYLNGTMPTIYREVYNWAEPNEARIETRLNVRSEHTVARLIKSGDIQLPKKKLDIPKDKRWNTKQLNSSVLQGILQGEDMRKIAKRILPVVDNNKNAAIRNARTMVTGAENAGKQDRFKSLEEKGAVIRKVWMATPDGRTRDSHIDIDGEEVEIGENFSNGLEYPGDPGGDPAEVYNCRCTMHSNIIGFRKENGDIVYIDGYDSREETMHERQMEEERERRRTTEAEAAQKKRSTEVNETIVSKMSQGNGYKNIPEDYKEAILEPIRTLDNERLLEVINNTSENLYVNWEESEGTSCYHTRQGSMSLYENKTIGRKETDDYKRQVFWHEYGHFVDDAKLSNSGYYYTEPTASGGYTFYGITNIVEDGKKYAKAACDDVNAFLKRYGLDDKYVMTIADEWSSQWLKYKESGEPVEIGYQMKFEDQRELSKALTSWMHEQSGYNKAINYLHENGYPKQVEYSDYMEAYRTPKRQTLKYRERFKGAEEKFYEDSRKISEEQDVWRSTHNFIALVEEQERLIKEAQKKENSLGWVTDTFDGASYGAFASVIIGGHTADYYQRDNGGIKEGVANVFMSEVVNDETITNGMKDLCPNVYKLIKGVINGD